MSQRWQESTTTQFQNIQDWKSVSNYYWRCFHFKPLFTVLPMLPRLAAESCSEHSFIDDFIFGGRQRNTVGFKQETLASMSQAKSNRISKTLIRTKIRCSTTTKLKHSVFWIFFGFCVQLFCWHAGSFNLNFGVHYGILSENRHFCHN